MLIFLWLAAAVLTAIAANARGRSAIAWFFIGLLSGFLGLIAVLVMGKIEPKPTTDAPRLAPDTTGHPVVENYRDVQIKLIDGKFHALGRTMSGWPTLS